MATNAQLDAQYTALLKNDPEMQALVQQMQALPFGGLRPGMGPSSPQQRLYKQMTDRAKALGVPIDQWSVQYGRGGESVGVDHQNWIERNPTAAGALILGSIVTGGMIAPSLIGGGTAAATGSATPALSSTGLSPLGLPGSTAVSLGGAPTAAAVGGSAWGNALKQLIPLGLQVGGTLANRSVQQSGIDAAQQAQQAATDAAQGRIDAAQQTAGDVYNQQRRDYQTLANTPFQALGNALGVPIGDIGPVSFTGRAAPATLGQLATMPAEPATARQRPPDVPATGTAQPRTLASLVTPDTTPAISPQQVAQQQSQSGYVRFRSPDGQVGLVPWERRQMAIEAGGTPLEG